uniref:NADH-ubiquinone oxidoreductase chain 4L n=1 Tax=Eumantispa harmandi TaxID=1593348 RepID=A0A1S5QYF3_9NEOP|nr:NADH dehydrogenase subunit 4L [Eumantispa harmandi]AMW67939.1 NADH dehydrogenase subunit 4L [Eumantispa harmandi]AYG51267.1 NADH dehydrogenase subunit 4L [Eumantispa harmandi]
MFLLLNILLSLFMFNSGILVYSLMRKHVLSTLLTLEFIVLSLFYLMYFYLMNYNYEFYFIMYFMIFAVCEGVLGLSILVSLIRTHGNDYFQSFNILQC